MSKPLHMRLAFRAEGSMVNAYIAQLDTMDDALLVASLSRRLCDEDPELFEEFKTLVTRGFTLASRLVLGVTPTHYETREAPQHEREEGGRE